MTLTAIDVCVDLGGRTIVHNVACQITPGELVVLLGPNGAGKTTLMRALCGVIPARGELTWQTTPISAMTDAERARTIAYLPQGHVAHWPMSVRDTVAIGRFPHASSISSLSATDQASVDAALDAVDATHLADRDVTTLSGGERARVLLARALAVEAPVLLADEPIAALDPHHQLAMATRLQAEARAGRAVLAVMHDLAIASRFADRVVLMHEGAVAAAGAPDVVLTDARLTEVFQISAKRLADGDRSAVLAWAVSNPGADN